MSDAVREKHLAVAVEQLAILNNISKSLASESLTGVQHQLLRLRELCTAVLSNQNRSAAQVTGYLQLLLERARIPWWRRLLGR